MFCYKCGVQLPEDAAFCYQCGSAVVQNGAQFHNNQQNGYQQNNCQPQGYQQNNYQPNNYQPNNYQPNNYQPVSYATITDGVNVVYPDGHSEIGDLTVTANEILFSKKSKFVRVAFGGLGSSLEQGQQALRLPVAEIVCGQKTRIGLNGNVYQITMRNGQVFKLCVEHPGTIKRLQERFG